MRTSFNLTLPQDDVYPKFTLTFSGGPSAAPLSLSLGIDLTGRATAVAAPPELADCSGTWNCETVGQHCKSGYTCCAANQITGGCIDGSCWFGDDKVDQSGDAFKAQTLISGGDSCRYTPPADVPQPDAAQRAGIRLVDESTGLPAGAGVGRGRLELLHTGRWGTVRS
jgi:hypothetical protein